MGKIEARRGEMGKNGGKMGMNQEKRQKLG